MCGDTPGVPTSVGRVLLGGLSWRTLLYKRDESALGSHFASSAPILGTLSRITGWEINVSSIWKKNKSPL